jgi:fucose permease
LLRAASFTIFVYGMVASALGALMPELGFTEEQNGAIASYQSVGLLIACISIGPLIDRRGKKFALVVGLGIIAAALCIIPRATGYGAIAAAMLTLGFGSGMAVTAANSLAGDIDASKRSATLNLLNVFFGLGGLLTPLIGAYFFTGRMLELCYWLAALNGAALLLNAVTPMARPAPGAAMDLGGVIFQPALALLSLFLFFYVACEAGVWNWLAKYLVGRGIPERTALRTLSLGFGLGMLAGRLAAARIPPRIPGMNVTLAASAAMCVTTLALLFAGSTAAIAASVFFAGVAMAPVFPTTLGVIGDAFPNAAATATGIAITAGWVGAAVSSRVIGLIAAHNPAGLGAALLMLPALALAMVALNLVARPVLKSAYPLTR